MLTKHTQLRGIGHYKRPFRRSGFPKASRRPILPKHTQLQNKTLAIHVQTPMLSFVMILYDVTLSYEILGAFARGEGVAGGGTMSGLTPRRTAVPVMPTMAERMKPGFDRSMRYQSTGLTSARVKETCRVDCQGSLRCTKRE